MHIEFQKFDELLTLESMLRKKWNLAEQDKVLFAPGLDFAIQEITKGIFARNPHKLTLAVQEDIRPELEFVIPAFTREGAKVIRYNREKLADAETLVQGLGKQGLFVLTASSDPVTSILNPFEDFSAKCANQRIPTICIQQVYQRSSPEAASLRVSIVPLSSKVSVIVAGEKVGFEYFAPQKRPLWVEDLLLNDGFEDKIQVQQFEANLPKGLQAPLFQRADRRYDRAVLLITGCDGSAFVELMSKQLGVDLFKRGIFVTSGCYWKGDLTTQWMLQAGWTSAELRSMIIVPIEMFEIFNEVNVKNVIDELTFLQNG